jgi:uncharacterized membrane protein
MSVVTALRVVAIACAGLLAGIYPGDRAGAHYARPELDPSSFVRFQQVVHVHYAKFMPPLVLIALLTALAWLVTVRPQWRSAELWLVAASVCGIALVAALTRAVNVPLNNELMTWNVAAPPSNLKEIWAPWARVNTTRAIVTTVVLVLEGLALSLRASTGRL